MGKHNFLKKAALATLIVAPLLITAPTLTPTAHAYETNPAGYEVPDLTGYEKLGQLLHDEDGDGKKETIFTIYRNDSGNFITTYSTSGRVWAFGKFRHRGDTQGMVIVDSNCDGVFDQKYSADEEFSLPSCLK